MQSPSAPNLKLIVHIGAGKTGSSSIQATLKEAQGQLAERGVAYLGMMLEYAAPKLFSWQFPGGSDEFFGRKDAEVASDEVYRVLSQCLPMLQAEGIGHAIWSNEWMFGRHENVLPALIRLREEGWDVEALCYVRRHDSWVKSAYIQWGIKHKTYEGPIRSYREWKKGRSFSFYAPIRYWHEALGDKCCIRNFDAAGDVVPHFLQEVSPAIADIPRIRENESPDAATLAAWLAYNARYSERVEPARFMRIARPSGILERRAPLPPIEDMLPNADDLQAVVEEYAGDFAKINEILANQVQPLLENSPKDAKPAAPGNWEMQVLLLRMVFSLQEQVFTMRKRINDLTAAAGNTGHVAGDK